MQRQLAGTGLLLGISHTPLGKVKSGGRFFLLQFLRNNLNSFDVQLLEFSGVDWLAES